MDGSQPVRDGWLVTCWVGGAIGQWGQSSGSNVISRRARPGLAGLRPHNKWWGVVQMMMLMVAGGAGAMNDGRLVT